jgi:hypothetical protein
LSFNTVYSDLLCPFCNEKVQSGVGFRWGVIANIKYQPGDRVVWRGGNSRPSQRPQVALVKTVGYFNCDNVRCSSWQDCYPTVQRALITIEDDAIKDVSVYEGEATDDGFDIIEPKDLS